MPDFKKMRIELEDLGFQNQEKYEKYIVKIRQENEHDQCITIKRIDERVIIEIPDDGGFFTSITIKPKDRTITASSGTNTWDLS